MMCEQLHEMAMDGKKKMDIDELKKQQIKKA